MRGEKANRSEKTIIEHGCQKASVDNSIVSTYASSEMQYRGESSVIHSTEKRLSNVVPQNLTLFGIPRKHQRWNGHPSWTL